MSDAIADVVSDALTNFRNVLLEHPTEALRSMPFLDAQVAQLRGDVILNARALGYTWAALADALGVARQTVWERYRWVDDEIHDSDSTEWSALRHGERHRYLERPVRILCTDCDESFCSTRGDTASISAKIIRRHDAKAHCEHRTADPLIAAAKDALRRGEPQAWAGRWLLDATTVSR